MPAENRLQVVKRKDGYWIVDPLRRIVDHGPYETIRGDGDAAEADRVSINRTLASEPSIFTEGGAE